MNLGRLLIATGLGASTVSCVSYSSIQMTDKEIYLSGGTNYFEAAAAAKETPKK